LRLVTKACFVCGTIIASKKFAMGQALDRISPKLKHRLFLALAVLGIAARLVFALSSGNHVRSNLSGGGDTDAYIRLSNSLYAGRGLTYYGQPSAFRPPAYPILLATCHYLFGANYLGAIRLLQFIAGLATAWMCARTAEELWGPRVFRKCFVLTLFFPTLLYFTGEILTETFAAFLASCFFYLLVRMRAGRAPDLARIGVVAGVAALLRFNTIFFPLIAALGVISTRQGKARWKGLLMVTLIPLAILLPWVVRNLIVFHGEVLYSTHTGMDLVEGLLRPQGRADTQQGQDIVRETGWSMQGLENEGPGRLRYPSEAILNRTALKAAMRLWRHAGVQGVRIVLQKIGYFWLSTDQLLDTGQLSRRVRFIRVLGVLVYWACLIAGLIGLVLQYKKDAATAKTLAAYLFVATCLHLLFAMNTRLRVPLVDPLICMLASFPIFPVRKTAQTDAPQRHTEVETYARSGNFSLHTTSENGV
jgi:4-amino-4-deoxy-L-arabinose transferase-like glycosyltransferase